MSESKREGGSGGKDEADASQRERETITIGRKAELATQRAKPPDGRLRPSGSQMSDKEGAQ
jgi:hypothetical protein